VRTGPQRVGMCFEKTRGYRGRGSRSEVQKAMGWAERFSHGAPPPRQARCAGRQRGRRVGSSSGRPAWAKLRVPDGVVRRRLRLAMPVALPNLGGGAECSFRGRTWRAGVGPRPAQSFQNIGATRHPKNRGGAPRAGFSMRQALADLSPGRLRPMAHAQIRAPSDRASRCMTNGRLASGAFLFCDGGGASNRLSTSPLARGGTEEGNPQVGSRCIASTGGVPETREPNAFFPRSPLVRTEALALEHFPPRPALP